MLKAVCWALIFAAIAIWQPSSSHAEPLLDTPVYNPETKSYFELVKIGAGWSIRGATIKEIGWRNAQKFAYTQTFKGVRGRLALVKSAATNDFLRQFQTIQPTWIGLRYWCAHRKLQLATGEFYPRTAYANWDQVWAHDGGARESGNPPTCNDTFRVWPVHYWSVQDGFRWNANGQQKEFRYIFIEFPTGKE